MNLKKFRKRWIILLRRINSLIWKVATKVRTWMDVWERKLFLIYLELDKVSDEIEEIVSTSPEESVDVD
jgi:hypothetical protein